jgi:hypothetical protein
VAFRSPAALLVTALAAGCAHGSAPRDGATHSQELTVGEARFRIVYSAEDAAAARAVRDALAKAVPKVARWGALRHPVTVTVHPSHAALEDAVDRPGHGWLHAWARFGTIDIQSPRTWGFFGASRRRLEELVTHELTHCAMYQLGGDEVSWMYKGIPRWFSEGLATVTAGQGYRYGDVEALWEFYQDPPPGSGDGEPGRAAGVRLAGALLGDPLVDPEPLFRARWHLVYGAAHQAMEFLLARYGEARVHRVLGLMGKGHRFPAAFREAIGLTDAEFAADFRRYVVWQGWR